MPTTTPMVKVNNTKDYGAKVILHGATFDDAAAKATEAGRGARVMTYIPPFNDLAVATGQGTIAYEIFQQPARCGRDSGAHRRRRSGRRRQSTLAKLLNPNVKVIGVEPTGAASMKASVEAGHVVTLENVETIADGVAVKTPGDLVFPYIQQNIDDIITIDDAELVDAFLDMIEKHKMIVENAGLLHHRRPEPPGLQGQERGQRPLRRQHGRHHRVLPGAARPDQPGPRLHLLRPAARPSRRAAAGGGDRRPGERQHHQAGSQPVRQHQPPERRGAEGDAGGLRACTHKRRILEALKEAGYDAHEVGTADFYD